MNLSSTEIRVLGCLLEKQCTTPDLYPLSLNSLRLACNQSTNRDPVVEFDDSVIRDALHRLERRGYARLASGAGSRAPKFRHLLADALPMSSDEQAVMCVLMLRGSQTPGELKQRTERLHPFADLPAIHETLGKLIERELVVRLQRRPGQKEERYEQLLGRDSESGPSAEPSDGTPEQSAAPAIPASSIGLAERVGSLEREVQELRVLIGELHDQLRETHNAGEHE
ncbi:MAG: YceH family protein [Solirubrobacteraceae bacterium]